jgi:hypothetical protein
MYRGRPAATSPLRPVADLMYRRTERVHVEWAFTGELDQRSARLLSRTGQPLAIPVTVTERETDGRKVVAADLNLAPLSAGEYVVELTVGRGAETTAWLVAFQSGAVMARVLRSQACSGPGLAERRRVLAPRVFLPVWCRFASPAQQNTAATTLLRCSAASPCSSPLMSIPSVKEKSSRGLSKAEDFQILEDGKPQAVENVEFVRVEPSLSEVGAPRSGIQSPRCCGKPRIPTTGVFVVFLDQLHVTIGGSYTTRRPMVDTC